MCPLILHWSEALVQIGSFIISYHYIDGFFEKKWRFSSVKAIWLFVFMVAYLIEMYTKFAVMNAWTRVWLQSKIMTRNDCTNFAINIVYTPKFIG